MPQRLQSRREHFSIVMVEVGVAGAHGEDERIVGQRTPVTDETPLRQLHGSDVGEQDGDVGRLTEHGAERLSDV